MGASVTGANGDGTFNVTDAGTGVTMPATMDQLAPHPELQAQAVNLSQQAMTQALVPGPAAPSGGINPDNLAAAPLKIAGSLLTGGPDAMMASLLSPPPAPQMVAGPPPVDVTQTPPPAPGTQGMAPAPEPAPQPAAVAPVGGGTPVPRGTVRASPVVTEQPGSVGALPVTPSPAQPDAAPAENPQDALVRSTTNEQGRINQAGINREQDALLNESAWQDQNRANMATEAQKYSDLRDAALKAHQIDPNKFWKDKGALGSIMFAISAGLQGAAGGWNGHPEAGAQFVEKKINQNIELQEKQAQSLDRAAEAQGNLVQLGRQMGLDHRSATMAAIPLMREMTAKSIEQAAYKPGMPNGFSLNALSVANGLREKNAAIAKTGAETHKAVQEGNKAAVETALAPAEASARIGAEQGAKAASYGSAAASRATAAHTGAETDQMGQRTRVDRIARQLAVEGHVIPPIVEDSMSPEAAKNLIGPQGARRYVNDPAGALKLLSDHGQYDATLAGAHAVASNPQATPEQLDQAANQAKVAAKVANELKRGGEGDKDLLNLNPGFKEFMGTKIDWAEPGRRERFQALINGERRNQAQRTTGALKPYGHPGVTVPASALVQPGVAP